MVGVSVRRLKIVNSSQLSQSQYWTTLRRQKTIFRRRFTYLQLVLFCILSLDQIGPNQSTIAL